ncbi:6615_t:CDS:1 [Dentiscutata heterogama]|uniref:6615_t:CDS:1 n=1 Tax=Dentiscutata heterogama TaxID=1316150 RepID=A0ACA9K6A7_9GLOM|nr:6615_t:CDS:1 [Dentiscutata heterogama]
MTFQSNLIEITNSLTNYEAENLIKILQRCMNKKSYIPSLLQSPCYLPSSSSLNNNFAGTPPLSPPPREEFISVQEFFSKGFHSRFGITPEIFFDLVNDIKMNGNFLKFTWRKRFPCPLCTKSGYHICCSRCKNLSHICNCKYACGLTYPVQFSSKGRGSSWKKCSFVTNKYDKQAITEHLKTCTGKIASDFTLMTLKIYPLDKEEGTTDTRYNKIKLDERRCPLYNDIHNMHQACYGENFGCWSSNTTLVGSSSITTNDKIFYVNDTGKKVKWDDWMSYLEQRTIVNSLSNS